MSNNRYGLDNDYFERKIAVLHRDGLKNWTPDEFARELARMSRTADASVMQEPEFAVPAEALQGGRRERFEKWVMATRHPVFGFLDGRSLARSDDREGYADEYVQGLWVAFNAFGVQPQGEPVTEAEERDKLISYGRSCGLDEAATLCNKMAWEAYYPPGTRFKLFTPKAQAALGNLLIKAANAIASLPDGPYDRFKARHQKTAEKSATA